jgi:uncharacterized membrane protein YeiH
MVGLDIAEVIGTIAFALSGFFVAVRDRLDLLGIFIASFLTALGGGILRDTIANRVPVTFSHLFPTILVVLVLLVSIFLKLHYKDSIEKKFYFIISDSIGLVAFSISGALVGIIAGFNVFGVIMLGLATAVGGGVMRDVLLNRIPVLLTSELYGSVAIIVSFVVYICDLYGLKGYMSLSCIFFFGFGLRLLAYYKKWHLPKIG